MGTTSGMRVWLSIGEAELRTLWTAALKERGCEVILAPAVAGGIDFAVVDEFGLAALRADGASPAWIIGIARDPAAAPALWRMGVDDVTWQSQAAVIGSRLVAAERAVLRARQVQGLVPLLRAVNDASLRVRDRDRLLNTVCELATRHGFTAAWVTLLDPETRALRIAAQSGAVTTSEALLAPADPALRSSRPATRDVLSASTRGRPQLFALPLRAGTRVIGAFTLRTDTPEAVGGLALPFLEDLAQDLSLSLELIDEEEKRKQAVAGLRARERRQAALAYLGQRALAFVEVGPFLEEVVEVTAETLGVELCRVLSAEEDGLRTCAARGYASGSGAESEPLAPAGSPGGFALTQAEPVLVEDYSQESRFAFTPALRGAGAHAGMHVVVPGRTRPWGVVEVQSCRAHRYSDDDVHFVQTVAALLAGFIIQRRSEEALRRSEQTFRTLIEASPDAVAVVREQKFVFVNPAWAAILGYATGAELVGRSVVDFMAPEEKDHTLERASKTLQSGKPNPPATFRKRRADGSYALMESVSLRVDFDGKPSVMILGRDIGERQAILEKLMLAERLASVGTLAAGVAHEINNPMAYVIANLAYLHQELEGLAGQLARAGSEAEGRLTSVREALSEAREGADRVRHIVKDLKTFSRADEERRGPVDVLKVLESSINMAWNELRHRARLVRELGPVPRVEANEARLGQVFLNLLINAAQAIPEGPPGQHEVRVVSRTDEQGRAIVEVHDTGVGIPPEMRRRIFDPFFTTKPVGVGTGLGLSICHGIVTRMGGELQVESEEGRGSCFRVMLPGTQSRSEAPARRPSVGAVRRGRILVVDDEPMVCASVKRALQHEHEVVVSMGARAALEELKRCGGKFDLVLCDLLMPEMTGMELHAEIQQAWPGLAGRMIFLSGGAFTPRAQAFLEEEHRTFLEKPFDIDRLRELVRLQLEGDPARESTVH